MKRKSRYLNLMSLSCYRPGVLHTVHCSTPYTKHTTTHSLSLFSQTHAHIHTHTAMSEHSILSDFLLSPSSLTTAMSQQQFTELFPKRLRSHPQIKALYQELQQLRDQDANVVSANIDAETSQGEEQKAELRRSLLQTGVDGFDASEKRDINVDAQLFGEEEELPDNFHSVNSLLAAMELACDSIEREIDGVNRSADSLLAEFNATVGELSDLRYGKMQGVGGSSTETIEEVKKGLERLEEGCYREKP